MPIKMDLVERGEVSRNEAAPQTSEKIQKSEKLSTV